MALLIPHQRFTVAEYHQMAEVGILKREDRVELINGEIIEMSAINSRHAASVKRLGRFLNRRVGEFAIVGVQDPIISELWIVDLQADIIEVYTQPANGSYQSIRKVQRGETLSPQALPSVVLKASEILG